jgi:MFS family permease
MALLLGALGVSTAFGMLLLLPLYVQQLGGDEADFGRMASAGTVTAALSIGALIRRPDRLAPHVVSALAIAAYGIGALAAGITETYGGLIVLGVPLGTAWAVVYTSMPMVMSAMVSDAERAVYFGYLTGTQQVGIGLGPVLGRQLLDLGLGLQDVFLAAGAVCVAAASLTLWSGRLAPGWTRPAPSAPGPGSQSPGLMRAMRSIASSDAASLLVMIMLFACLFTTMTHFQTTFARSRGLHFSIFYVTYTTSVIVSRLVIAAIVRRRDPALLIALSVSVMTTGVVSFLLVGSNAQAYAAASALLGLGYGLALPTVQARAVNVSHECVRPRVLPLVGLVFMTAILGFPIVAGALITSFGYRTLFAVLLSLAGIQALIAWQPLFRTHRSPLLSL